MHLILIKASLMLLFGRMDPKQNKTFTSLSDSLTSATIMKV